MENKLGNLLNKLRFKNNESLHTMAKKLCMSTSYLSSIENKTRNIPFNMEKLIKSAYKLTAAEKRDLKQAVIEETSIVKIELDKFNLEGRKIIYLLNNRKISQEKLKKVVEVLESR